MIKKNYLRSTIINSVSYTHLDVYKRQVPGHCGIVGNERADEIVKASAKMQPNQMPQMSLSKLKNDVMGMIQEEWKERWRQASTGRRLFELQPTPTDHKLYEGVPREIATFAARARTGHIVTQQYLFRFKLSTSLNCENCGEQKEESLAHILLECTSINGRRDRLRALIGDNGKLEDVLRTKALWGLAAAVYYGHRAIGIT